MRRRCRRRSECSEETPMDGRKYVLAVIAYIVVTFAVAASWHLVFFKDLYDQLAIFTRKEPLIPLGLVSILTQALILAYLYPVFYKGGGPAKEGLKFGLI